MGDPSRMTGIQTAILDALSAHIALVDRDGIIIAVNATWRQFAEANALQGSQFGLGQNYLAICEAARDDATGDALAMATGLRGVLEGRLRSFSFEYPCHSPTQQRWFLLSITPLSADQPSGAVIAHTDITQRKLAEAKQQRDAERFITTLESITDAFFTLDREWRFTYVNPPAEASFKRPRTELLGKNIWEVFPESRGRPFMAEYERAMRDNVATHIEDYSTVLGAWLDLRIYPSAQGLTVYFRDVSERHKLEQQVLRAQRMESIGTLAGGIAHDLNNVLSPIVLAINLLAKNEIDTRRLGILAIIESSAKRGSDMVRQVLSFARGIEGQRLPVPTAQLLHDIGRIVNDTFLKNIQVHIVIADDIWAVIGDATQLHQVLLNLCVNARDAMPDGGSLTLSADNLLVTGQDTDLHGELKPGPHVVIRVADTGSGIPPAIIERIFEPFFTTKEVGKGTGLGLSTSLAVVKSHGGCLRVESQPAHGTVFTLHLPALTAAGSTPDPTTEIPLPQGHGELVLVVDDEAPIRLIAQQLLEANGYRVILASDGREALELFAERQDEIALVLTDMVMPLMDGDATIRALQALRPGVRIIAASGLPANQILSTAASTCGVKHFLSKPYTVEALLTSIHEVLYDR